MIADGSISIDVIWLTLTWDVLKSYYKREDDYSNDD